MPNTTEHRTLIIGNSGSGKSTLADHIAAGAGCRNVDLDMIHWEDLASGRKRDEATCRQMTATIAAEPHWVIEGVYGWLAEVAVPRATTLIWLDLPWEECRAGLIQRGPRRGSTAVQFDELLSWAEQYWNRQSPSSFAGHSQIYDRFPGQKVALRSKVEIDAFVLRPTVCIP